MLAMWSQKRTILITKTVSKSREKEIILVGSCNIPAQFNPVQDTDGRTHWWLFKTKLITKNDKRNLSSYFSSGTTKHWFDQLLAKIWKEKGKRSNDFACREEGLHRLIMWAGRQGDRAEITKNEENILIQQLFTDIFHRNNEPSAKNYFHKYLKFKFQRTAPGFFVNAVTKTFPLSSIFNFKQYPLFKYNTIKEVTAAFERPLWRSNLTCSNDMPCPQPHWGPHKHTRTETFLRCCCWTKTRLRCQIVLRKTESEWYWVRGKKGLKNYLGKGKFHFRSEFKNCGAFLWNFMVAQQIFFFFISCS